MDQKEYLQKIIGPQGVLSTIGTCETEVLVVRDLINEDELRLSRAWRTNAGNAYIIYLPGKESTNSFSSLPNSAAWYLGR